MAESHPPANVTVQELVINGKLPERYIYKGSNGGVLDASAPLMEIPLIDIGLLTSPSSSREELEKLHSALSSWGCILVINHGMTDKFLDKVREITKQFFALPVEEKQKYTTEIDSNQGYGNEKVLSEHQTLDWSDLLHLMVSPEDQRKLKFWPENPEDFRKTLHEYSMKLHLLIEVLLKAMARSLNLDDNCFLNQYGERAIMSARFNFYPPCPRPDLVLGVKPHADGSAITILLQDKEVEGLQFLKDNQWVRAPIIPQALLVNVGDQVEIMSNGIFKSPLHRVLTNSERERISVAVFSLPRPDKEIEPAEGLVDETRPRLYKKVKSYGDLCFQYYQQGKRSIEAVKI